MNQIIINQRHNNNIEGDKLAFNQKDAEEMINNLVKKQYSHKVHINQNENEQKQEQEHEQQNFGEAINFIMRKNKYQIETEFILNENKNGI